MSDGQYFQYERESYVRSQSPSRQLSDPQQTNDYDERQFDSRYSPSYNRQLENSPSFQEASGIRSYQNAVPIQTDERSSFQPQLSPSNSSVESKFDQFLAATESRVKELREQANASIARIQSLSQRSASPTHSRPLDTSGQGYDAYRQPISSPRSLRPQTSPLSHPTGRASPIGGAYSPSTRSPSHQQEQYRQSYSSPRVSQAPNTLSRQSPERNPSPNYQSNRASPPAEQYEWLRHPSPLEPRSSSPGPQTYSPSYSQIQQRQPSPQRYSPSQTQKYSYSTSSHEIRQPSPEPTRPSVPLRPDTPPRSYPSDIPSVPPTITNRSPSYVAGSSPSLRSRSPSGRTLDRPSADNRSPKTYSPTYGQAPTHSPNYGQAPSQTPPYGQARTHSPTYGQAPSQAPYGQGPSQSPAYGQAPNSYGQAPTHSPSFGLQHSPSYSQPPRTQSPYHQHQQEISTRSPRYTQPQENRPLSDLNYPPSQQQQQQQQQQPELGGQSGYRSPIFNGGRANNAPTEYHEETERYHLIRGSPSATNANTTTPHNLIPGNTSSPIYNAGSQLTSRVNDIPYGGSPNSQRGIVPQSQSPINDNRAPSSPSYFGGGSPIGSSRPLQSSPNTTPTSRYINPVRTDITYPSNLTPSQRSPLYNGGFQPATTNRPLSDPYADLAAPPSNQYVPQLSKPYDNSVSQAGAAPSEALVEEYHLVRETVSYQ